MRYVQFYIGEREALGSDGVMPLDGRLSLQSCIMAAAKQARSLRKVQPRYDGFRIMQGKSFSTGKALTGHIGIVRSQTDD